MGYRKKEELLRLIGSPNVLFEASEQELAEWGLTDYQRYGVLKNRSEKAIQAQKEQLLEKNIRFVSREEDEYPERLRHIYCPPCGLYVRGNLPEAELPAIAIVGARACSAYGSGLSEYFAKELTAAGCVVVSGLADGVDAAAHRGALKAKEQEKTRGQEKVRKPEKIWKSEKAWEREKVLSGEQSANIQNGTVAVLGCGVDLCYPKENFNLYREIGDTGALISEYPPGTIPDRRHFPERNRIIAGLSDGILITEAKQKSGSLITASLGLEQGKDIFAIPGRLGDVLSEGCNELIRAGAKLVMTPNDILQEYERIFSENKKKSSSLKKFHKIPLETPEKIVYDNLGFMPKHIDMIANECNMSVSDVSGILLSLELKGYLARSAGHSYVRSPDRS